MSQKTKRQKSNKHWMCLNIGDLLRQKRGMATPKMADYPGAYSKFSDELSLGEKGAVLPMPGPPDPDTSPVTMAGSPAN
ncbi:Hypothetical predicted protein [Pelobates cultripes]|uniref:Uncharacterized protein n=1 Tax=Pelobates cultripes TaxID=61616 RepID=A0AAD1R8G4_PELCU|nr:Hypothetical predicted protein [Pelobates cultripes]